MYFNNLQIYRTVSDLQDRLIKLDKRMNRTVKYVTYAKMLDECFMAFDDIYLANSMKSQRSEFLTSLIGRLVGIKTRIKFFEEHKFVDAKSATLINNDIDEALKQAYGWRDKSVI